MSRELTDTNRTYWTGYKSMKKYKKRLERFVNLEDISDNAGETSKRGSKTFRVRRMVPSTFSKPHAVLKRPKSVTKKKIEVDVSRIRRNQNGSNVTTEPAGSACNDSSSAVPTQMQHSEDILEKRGRGKGHCLEKCDNIFLDIAQNFRDTFLESDGDDGPADVSIEEEPEDAVFVGDPMAPPATVVDDNDGQDLPCEWIDGKPHYSSAKVQSMLLDVLAIKFASVKAETLCSHSTAEKFFNLIMETLPLLRVIEGSISYKTVQRRAAESLPPLSLSHVFREIESDTLVKHEGQDFPTKTYGDPLRYKLVATWTRLTLRDACKTLQEWHPNDADYETWDDFEKDPLLIDLSWDGVSLDKKNSNVLEVLSLKSTRCNNVLPIGIYIGETSCKDSDEVLGPLIQQWSALNLRGRHFLMDSKARLSIMKMVAINGYFSCQYCLAPGTANQKSGEGHKRGGRVVWPSSMMGYQKRTHAMYIADGEKAQKSGKAERGTYGVSRIVELFDDVMTGVPIDTFHCVYLGMAKRIWKEIFCIRANNTMPKEMEVMKKKFDHAYQRVEVPSEIQRRPRAVDTANFKFSEWKSLSVYGFPLLADMLTSHGRRKEASIVVQFSFLLRALLMSDSGYNHLKRFVDMPALNEKFYKSFEKTFGKEACVPSLHLFYHLVEQRERVGASITTTEPFETYYNVLRSTYAVGTTSMGKQQLNNTILYHKAKQRHTCRKTYKLRPKGRDMHNDSLVWTIDGRFLEIQEVKLEGTYSCCEIETVKYASEVVRKLFFGPMGVAREKKKRNHQVLVSQEEIAAKVVRVGDVLVSVPTEALFG